MKKTVPHFHFRSRLILVQFFLVVPLITIVLFVFAHMIRSSVMAELENSRMYSLQTAAVAFDRIYSRAHKILETPYTNATIYNAVCNMDGSGDELAKKSDYLAVQSTLYRDVLYYEPLVTSITIVSEVSKSTYYVRQAPANSVNIQSPYWHDLTQSAWYKATVVVDEPVVFPAAENELYIGSGITLGVTQRLKDVMRDRLLGAVRVDINLSMMYRDWDSIAGHANDVFVVLDHTGGLVYASSPVFVEQYPLLGIPDTSQWQNDYRVSSFAADESGFMFYYLAHPASTRFDMQILYGLPLLFAVISLIYSALFIGLSSHYISRIEAASREQEKAQLAYEVLRSKINPHFLYNTMNAIRWKAEMLGMREISRALESLASLLRFSIKSSQDIIPFTQELEQLENYVQIMRIRYGGDVDVAYDVDEACAEYQCLKFLLQPAVENSFIHAFSSYAEGTKCILVQAAVEDSYIRIVVEDNGGGMSREQIEELFDESPDKRKNMFVGIGIGNVHQRIKLLFGNDYGLVIESELDKYTRVIATIPKIKTEDVENDNTAGG